MARGKFTKIQDPNDPVPTQSRLFEIPGVEVRSFNPFPPILRTDAAIRDLISAPGHAHKGVDLEFNDRGPTIIGVSTQEATGAVRWDPELAQLLIEESKRQNFTLVAHAALGADKKEIEKALGVKTPLEMWDDSMVTHYLVNADLVKAPGKTEDDDDAGALGFMGLWTLASLTTEVPHWKTCRGKACEGPCPRHDVFGYCAIDSWVGLVGHVKNTAQMVEHKIPHTFYRELMEVGHICQLMEDRGVAVDMEYVRNLESISDKKKLELFPFETRGSSAVYTEFNPRSGDQVKAWFSEKGLSLATTDKKLVRKELEKRLRKAGITTPIKELQEREESVKFPDPVLDMLWRLDSYKNAGKGLSAWFDAKYLEVVSKTNGLISVGLAHPRFNHTGASTGRFSSSRPNFQNIPARGFGALVRAAIIARDKGLHLIKADFSQLELRMVLWLAGVDPNVVDDDFFLKLVARSNGLFLPAAAAMHGDERDVAKTVVHASSYLEGIKILYPGDLIKSNVRRDIEYGALRVYQKKYMPELKRDWDFRGGVVAFTGANLSERLFGSKTLENRKKALQIQDIYLNAFPDIRGWHMSVLDSIESSGYVQSLLGRRLPLYGSPEDDAKMAAAFLGQGTSADHVQGMMLRYYREAGAVPLLQVHDELVFEINANWTNRQAYDFIQLMGEESGRPAGFKSKFKAGRGDNWLAADPKKNPVKAA